MKKLIALVLSLSGLSSVASAATWNVTSGQSTSAIQGIANTAVAGDTVLFAAGTYNLTAPLTLKCGVTYTGPTATPATVVITAAGTGASTGAFNLYSNSNLSNPCTQQTSITYVNFKSNVTGIYVQTSFTNLLIDHDQFTYIPGSTNQTAGIVFQSGTTTSNTASILTNTTLTHNQFGDANSCISPTNVMTNTDSPETYEGACNGIVFFTSINGLTIKYNNWFHVAEGVHINCPNYAHQQYECEPPGGAIVFNLVAEFNDFSNIHRINWEQQPQQTSGEVWEFNSSHDWFDPYFGSFGLSMACCYNGTTPPNMIASNNVVLFNVGAGANARYGYGMEAMGKNAVFDHELLQAATSSSNAPGMAWGCGNVTSMSNNTVQGNFGGYIVSEGNFPCGTVTQPTLSGNVTGSSITTVTSVTPSISPAAGAQSFPLVVTLTDAGYTSGPVPLGNTGIWYTTDGSTPVPGSGTAQRVDSGGTFTLNSAATVKAVGMWGSANQPASHPTGYGFVASAVVSSTFTSGGTATLTSMTLSGTQVLAFPPATTSQLSATGVYSNGTTGPVTPTGWNSTAPSVATVSTSGLVTAVSAGTTNITATLSSVTSSPTYTITVSTPTITSGHLSTTPTDGINKLIVGNTQQFQPVATYANGATGNVTPSSCTWSIINGTAMTVNSSGLVTAASAGTSSVQTICGGVTFSRWDVTVAAATLSSTSLNSTPVPGIATASVPNTVQLATTGTYSNGTSAPVSPGSYTSSTLSQCTVNSTGLVAAVAAGACSITSTTGAVVSSTYPITISAATLNSISVTGPSGSMPTGTTQQLTATGTYSDGSSHNMAPATWVSLSTTLCSVDSSGNVSAIAVGTCNITAVQGNITSSTFNIDIVIPPQPTQFTALDAAPVISASIVGETVQLKALGVLPNGFFGNPTGVTWASNNTDVATVDANGVVTLVGIGTAQISASISSLTAPSVSIISLPSFANATNQYSPCCSLLYGLTVGSHTLVVHTNGSVTIN